VSLPAIATAWLISLVMALAGGWRLGIDHVKASAADADKVRAETIAAAQQGAADAISKIEIKQVTIRQAVETRIRDVPVYRDCRHAPGMLDSINAALTGQPAGDRVMPAASAPDR
jgi:hypothetical protein